MKDWKIVKSKLSNHPLWGYPMPNVLCKSLKEAKEYVLQTEFKENYYIEDYNDSVPSMPKF